MVNLLVGQTMSPKRLDTLYGFCAAFGTFLAAPTNTPLYSLDMLVNALSFKTLDTFEEPSLLPTKKESLFHFFVLEILLVVLS